MRVKRVRGCSLVVGSGACDGLSQPSNDRKPATSRRKGKKGKRTGKTSSHNGGQFSNLGTLSLANTTDFTCRISSAWKRPTETGTTRGVPHHAPRLRPDQCMLCRQVVHRASECPNKGNATSFSLGKRAFGTHALGCAVIDGI